MNHFTLPWGAWYGDIEKQFKVPQGWDLSLFNLESKRSISDEEMEERLKELPHILAQKKPKDAVIAVDDLTRPVKLERFLPKILQHFNSAGIADSKIKILFGLGSHHGLSKENMIKKLGRETVKRVQCLNHNSNDVVPIDVVWGKTEIKLNRHYVEAGFKMVISGLTAHSFAGFSGGAKMLFPGLADIDTLAKTHKSVLMGFMGKLGSMENNKFRTTIEAFVEKVGIDYFAGVVINADRSARNIYCGHYVDAHRKAAEEARAYSMVVPPKEAYDLVISSAYPKDSELLQAENGFIPLKSATANALLKPGGTYVVMAACSEGMGHHGLFGLEGKLYRKPKPIRFLKEHNFVFFSENVTEEEFHSIYSTQYPMFSDWADLLQHITPLLPTNPRVAVFPYGSMQLTS